MMNIQEIDWRMLSIMDEKNGTTGICQLLINHI